ncbi:MAG: hypothetical protein JWR67_1094 [Mucilaginibacter sp.]|nr:hypothetical protein [Mucilaginibacter sp.]
MQYAMQGYNAVWHGQKSWNGVAILERNSESGKPGGVFEGCF